MSNWYFVQADACAHDQKERERRIMLEQDKIDHGHSVLHPAQTSRTVKNQDIYRLATMIEAASRADTVYFMIGWRQSWACRILWDACQKFNVFVLDEIEVTIK